MAEPGDCAVVVLAAGGSTRMGTPKQLIRVEGVPLLRRAAVTALDADLGPVFVVLGAEADAIRPSVADLHLTVVQNPDWREGLASSLRAGLDAVLSDAPAVRGLIAMPADMPRLTAAHLRALAAAQRAGGVGIVASDYGDHRGPPAFFARAEFPALAKLRGDAGARGLLAPPAVATVAAPPGSHVDLDRPEDLERLRGAEPGRPARATRRPS